MALNVRTIIERISEFLLPPKVSSVKELDRKRLFLLFVAFLATFLFFFGTVHLINGVYIYWILDHGAAVILAVFMLVLRRMKSGAVLYRGTIIMIGTLFLYWIKTGAVQGYASVWVLTTPLFIFFLTGRREGLFWTGIITAGTILFFVNPFSLMDVWAYPPEYVIRLLIALFVILVFTYSYESVRERSTKAIEKEQLLILREKEQLAAANSEVELINRRLREEMDIRIVIEDELRKHRDHLEEIVDERTRELQRYNLELVESEKRYRLLADNVTDLIFSLDLQFRVLYISPSITSMYGYTTQEALALTMKDIHTPESLKKVMKFFAEQMELEKSRGADPDRNVVLLLKHRRKDGSLFDVEIRASFIRDESGKPAGIVGIARDVTERVQAQRENETMQEQLAQAQKMEAIGTLAGGIAHDFNNILSGILGSFDLLRLTLGKENLVDRETVDKYLDLGLQSATRSVNLIRELLAISQRHEIKLEPVDMNEAVRHINELCTNSFPKSIELDFTYAPDRPVIMGDMVQIGQVLLNFCINASHAMTIMRGPGERQGGRLSVSVDVIGPGHGPDGSAENGVPSGHEWVRISIGDTGVGMDRETVKHIYEPFYTRKKRGEGTGLGLSISYNIIQKHGGHIRIQSEPGVGSRFMLFFPYSAAETEHEPSPPAKDELVRGSGTILVIDDEAMILNVARGFLELSGYAVVTADNPERGIDIFRELHGSIAAVIIDLAMPGKNGLEVFRALKDIHPGVRAVLSSGMLDNESKEQAVALGIKDFVNKPYSARDLSVKIHGILA
ncbi:MAG TPA: PAS domain S-box protein [Spirochaetota bacterium]|nr:PAS domain S-box protein [Spirochaetota bacterium]HPL15753.1 PAS domain S-box protein [Spirochaetota bacterium]HQF07812.1 PAS domain S-box protein [Spirochaetota bacterium]HQH96865.1 PAS domain S-box protein [Spirochaetota bacterium]HQJ70628.1 PAS domain S-box protein [Spirochaetota bacterium]